jgi:hypothetical protein
MSGLFRTYALTFLVASIFDGAEPTTFEIYNYSASVEVG